jgi:alpha-mannosidase
VLFPTTIRCSEATYEVQFGHIKRPTHRNTTWDQARFEVHGHKFADLSEYGYGVSLLNDCKYGYSTKNNVMTLSLLRAPKMPDERCDMGEHEFSYALLPHLGTFQECAVVQEAHNFNAPLIISSRLPFKEDVQELSLFKSSHSGIVVDTVKKAEDDDSVIVRLYEAFGGYQANVTLETQLPLKSVKRCNLLEEEEKDVSFNDNKISIGGVNPFQIVTLKLKH